MSTDHARTQAELGQALTRLRLSRGLTQKDLAALAGVGVTSLQRLESGRGGQVGTLLRVATALGATQWLRDLAPTVEDSAAPARKRAFAPRTRRPRGTEQADGA